MKKIGLLLFLLVFALIGCQNKQLSIPQNFAYDQEGFIIWNEVDSADEYIIYLEGHEFVSQDSFFDVTDIITEKGTYEVEIIAISDDFESSPPVVFSITVGYNLNAEIDLETRGDSLIWEPVFLAKDYLVSYGMEFVRVDSASFDLSTFSSGDFDISVQAVFPDGSKTETFTYNFTK